ncbi:MAG: hypothetical protein ETSY1_37065 [Candidatus Entotheonella factor]|uniref:Uncharacterized protein n=1 Tax=Entotheonella factor TaxID=1429438 RepID=W4L7C0_ENTF1|nr:MAG: hypothetical protein ETSY1_37065 [Candidatus Entotheonella factor]
MLSELIDWGDDAAPDAGWAGGGGGIGSGRAVDSEMGTSRDVCTY